MNVINVNLKFKNPLTPLNLNNIKYIVIHHPEAKSASPEQIHQWHLENGWSGFGYNEYIRKDGTVYIGRGDNVGAQAQGYNEVSYGICVEGNYDVETEMSQIQMDALIERLIYHSKRFRNAQIVGHRDLMSTHCPGINFPWQSMIEQLNTLKILNDPRLINSPSYWRIRLKPNKTIKGEYAKQLILKYTAMFKLCNTYDEVLNHLVTMGVIKSPDYWRQNAVDGKDVNGGYMKQLIINMGSKI